MHYLLSIHNFRIFICGHTPWRFTLLLIESCGLIQANTRKFALFLYKVKHRRPSIEHINFWLFIKIIELGPVNVACVFVRSWNFRLLCLKHIKIAIVLLFGHQMIPIKAMNYPGVYLVSRKPKSIIFISLFDDIVDRYVAEEFFGYKNNNLNKNIAIKYIYYNRNNWKLSVKSFYTIFYCFLCIK